MKWKINKKNDFYTKTKQAQSLPHWVPTWEMQLWLKIVILQIWLLCVSEIYREKSLKLACKFVSKVWKVSGRCLDGVRMLFGLCIWIVPQILIQHLVTICFWVWNPLFLLLMSNPLKTLWPSLTFITWSRSWCLIFLVKTTSRARTSTTKDLHVWYLATEWWVYEELNILN